MKIIDEHYNINTQIFFEYIISKKEKTDTLVFVEMFL